MMRVAPQPEPDDFQALVAEPGAQALREGRDPLPAYWRRCLRQLWKAYGKVCCYSCMHIAAVTGARTVDHYLPKSAATVPGEKVGDDDDGDPHDVCARQSRGRSAAYDWSNYRLACATMNARKRAHEDVLDPFEVQTGWFEIEFGFFQLVPAADLDPATMASVTSTIERLALNDDDCRGAREEWYSRYQERRCRFSLLREMSPFVAHEIDRQGRRWAGDE
jgi:hypothetical protein